MASDTGNRMLDLLFLVGYCGEVPSQLVLRIGGHPEWNRHVKYQAVKKGYLVVSSSVHRQRVIRSLRLTEAGLDYISEKDPHLLAHILARDHAGIIKWNIMEKTLRRHSLAIALVMAIRAGAIIMPDEKPLLLSKAIGKKVTPPGPSDRPIFYSTEEIRAAIQEYEPDTVAKTSRILGIIINDRKCFCLYHTGRSRMYWMRNHEENTVASIDTLLAARGLTCQSFEQVIISDNMHVAIDIAKHGINSRSRYFTLTDQPNHCYFLENSANGDRQLSILLDPLKQQRINNRALNGFDPPRSFSRTHDAVTKDGTRPVVLGYNFDLLSLVSFDAVHHGFPQSPILLCFDYQADTLQEIVGPKVEVRTFSEEVST